VIGSRRRLIVGVALIAILVFGVDSALGVTTISNTIISGVTAFVSSAADPADAGVLRLGNTETICWEANPTGTDVCVQADASNDFLLDTSWNNVNLNSNPLTNAVLGGTLNANNNILDNVQYMESNAGTPASTGIIRLSNAENGMCWEPNPSGTAEVCLSVDASEDFVFDTDTNNINLNSNPLTNTVLGGTLDGTNNIIQDYRQNVATVTGATTLTADQEVILVSASSVFTITLPASSGNTGKHYQLIKTDNGWPTTIDGNGAETINGATTIMMEHKYETTDLYSDGSNWFAVRKLPEDSSKYAILEEEFSNASTDSMEIGNLGWFIGGVNSETNVGLDPTDLDHIGIQRIGTAATAIGDDVNIALGGSVTLGLFDFDSDFDLTWIVRPSDITNVQLRFGLAEDATSNNIEANDNAIFKFDPAVSANWQCITFNASAQTTTTSTVVTLNQWYVLKIIRDGTTIRFFIDDVNVCNHSTQVPDEVATVVAAVDNTVAASATITDLDYMLFIVSDISR
jgi:hypothetical protein